MAKTSVKNSESLTPNKLKLFKNSELMEGFYRYIHENSLREEACGILQFLAAKSTSPKKRKRRGKILQ